MPYAHCTTCSAPLDVPGRPWSRNCGGDCIACMADAGDPECVEDVEAMRAGEDVVRAGRDLMRSIRAERLNLRLFTNVPDVKLVALRDALPPEKGEER